MRVLGAALAALGVAGVVLGVGAMLGTCFGGANVGESALAPGADGTWRVTLPPVALAPGTSVAIDTWSDYDGGGAILFQARAISATGAAVTTSEMMTDDEGGSTTGSWTRVGRFEPSDAGPWTIEVSAHANGGVAIRASSAVVRAGALDLEMPGVALLTIGILLLSVSGSVFSKVVIGTLRASSEHAASD